MGNNGFTIPERGLATHAQVYLNEDDGKAALVINDFNVSASTVNTFANVIELQPFILNKALGIQNISISVSTAAAGGLCRMGIYRRASGATPALTLLYDTGDIDCSTTGKKTVTPVTPIGLSAGTYYIGVITNNNTIAFLTPSPAAGPIQYQIISEAAGGMGRQTRRTFASAFGALPATINNPTVTNIFKNPVIRMLTNYVI